MQQSRNQQTCHSQREHRVNTPLWSARLMRRCNSASCGAGGEDIAHSSVSYLLWRADDKSCAYLAASSVFAILQVGPPARDRAACLRSISSVRPEQREWSAAREGQVAHAEYAHAIAAIAAAARVLHYRCSVHCTACDTLCCSGAAVTPSPAAASSTGRFSNTSCPLSDPLSAFQKANSPGYASSTLTPAQHTAGCPRVLVSCTPLPSGTHATHSYSNSYTPRARTQ